MELDERYVWKEVKHSGGNVMVWGCVTTMRMGHIIKIDGNMDGLLYTEMLKGDILGTLCFPSCCHGGGVVRWCDMACLMYAIVWMTQQT